MAKPCRSDRAACVLDTLRHALHTHEFTTGVHAGLVALGATIVVGVVWWRVRPRVAPLPIVGLAAVAGCVYALHQGIGLPHRVVLALVLLAIGGLVVDALHLSMALLFVAALPGAAVLDSAPFPDHTHWMRLLLDATTIIGGVALVSFDRRWARHGLGAPLVALWAVGAYVTLPDTESALAVLGVLLVVAVAAWPLRLASVGACGALPIAGLMAWMARFGGFGRPASMVGAVACIGVLVIEPATRALRGFGSGPLDVLAVPGRGRWWTLVAVAPIQLGLIFVAGRVAGLGHSVRRAVAITLGEGVVAVALGLLITVKYPEKD